MSTSTSTTPRPPRKRRPGSGRAAGRALSDLIRRHSRSDDGTASHLGRGQRARRRRNELGRLQRRSRHHDADRAANWTCHGLYGADGSGGLLISPAGESVPSDPDPGGAYPRRRRTRRSWGTKPAASPVQGAALACPLFASAAAATKQDLGQGCPVTRPSQESLLPAGTAGIGIGFEDPIGVAGDGIPSGGLNPANGVMLYLPARGRPTAYLATCTLPDAQHDVCSAVLDHFVAFTAELSRVDRPSSSPSGHRPCRVRHSGEWQTASTLLPSGSRTNAP